MLSRLAVLPTVLLLVDPVSAVAQTAMPAAPATASATRACLSTGATGTTAITAAAYTATQVRTGELAERLSSVALPPQQKNRIDAAVRSADAVRQSARETGCITREHIEGLRGAEQAMVQALWESPAEAAAKAVSLEPAQIGYVFEGRFEELQRTYSSEQDRDAILQATGKGLENARALSQLNDLAEPRGLRGTGLSPLGSLLASFDTLTRPAPRRQRLAKPEDRAALDQFIADLGQQVKFSNATQQTLVTVTVKTVTTADKKEQSGYRIHYELKGDYDLRNWKNTSLDQLTRVTGKLGPFSYVFWAEKLGAPPSPPTPINLGEPLLESRDLEISVP
jgi:hypothetical protein